MSNNTADTVRIEVTCDSSSAVSGIKKLNKTLEKLQSAASGANKELKAVQKHLVKIAEAADKINSGSAAKMYQLADSMKTFNAAGNSSGGSGDEAGCNFTDVPLDPSRIDSISEKLTKGTQLLQELSAKATSFIGEIVTVGQKLEQVGTVWQPVIDNIGTVAAATGLGIGIMVVLGVACAGLGLLPDKVTTPLTEGIPLLQALSANATSFIQEIVTVGQKLEQVGTAWQPVIDNIGTVAAATGLGIGIMVVLGAACVGLGLLPDKVTAPLTEGIQLLQVLTANATSFIQTIVTVGQELEQVGIAWQPVLDNIGTVATATGLGIGIIIALGAACAGLGLLTDKVIAPLAMGILLLQILAANAILFIQEIVTVGQELNQVGISWQPVLDNGATIASAIGIGTGLLIGIGAVTAALGVATVASAGLLPVAIGLGTALLVELAAAFVELCNSLIDVANKLIDLSIPMDRLNAILPGLKTDMDNFTSFMGDFALAVVAFTAASAIAGIAATIDKVISFFTTDPIQRMYNEVTDQTKEFETLIPALEKINPLIEKATKLVGIYKAKMGSFESATGGSGGFLNSIVNGAKGVVNGLIGLFEGMVNGIIKGINFLIKGLNKISFNVPDWVPNIGGKKFGINISTISEISIPRFAAGGFPQTGQMFIAREAGPEMVGTIGNKSAVVNNEQIIAGISEGVADANAEQNALLREEISILRKILDKDISSSSYGGARSIISDIERKNRRDGKTVIPVGV